MEERENGGERERERQRERERNIDVIEKHRLEASHTPPTGDGTRNLFVYVGDAPTN